jgi:hypothetical protein
MTAMLKVMSASIAFSAAFSSTAFAGVQNWGPPLMSAQIIRKNIRAKCAGCINAAARARACLQLSRIIAEAS